MRADIVAFKTPPEAATRCGAGGTFVKRIVGLPGELVSERDGIVYLDGKPLRETYVKPARRDHEPARTWPRVPKGHYFLLGDNRALSCDSRVFGPVSAATLLGRTIGIYWPTKRLRRF